MGGAAGSQAPRGQVLAGEAHIPYCADTMKNIYTFGRKPAQRNYTIPDLRALKGSGNRLTMCNPAGAAEIRACVEAGIDTLTVWDDQLEIAREIAPTHFMGTAMNWGQHKTNDEILRAAVECMEAGADMYFTNRSYDVIEMLANEHIPVQAHMGLVPSVSIWGGGLRAYGRTADEALELLKTCSTRRPRSSRSRWVAGTLATSSSCSCLTSAGRHPTRPGTPTRSATSPGCMSRCMRSG